MKNLFILAASMVLLSLSVQAQNVAVRGVRLAGSGCASALGGATMTADGKILSILFDNYGIEIGQGSANPTLNSIQKDCRILIDVEVPEGFQYALEQTDYRGFAALPASAYGMHRLTQIIPGQPIVSMREAAAQGPLNTNYLVSVKQKPGRLVYSQCHQQFQTIELLSQLLIRYLPGTTDRSMAMINLDSVDTQVASSFVLNWRPCQ